MAESCTVSQLVSGTALDPDDATKLVNLTPTWTQRVGEPMHPSDRGSPEGKWKVSVVGPTPVNATRVANDLARDLFARLPVGPEWWTSLGADLDFDVRFSFAIPSLLTFSYELDAEVIDRIAQVGARMGFFHYVSNDDGPVRRYGRSDGPCYECQIQLGVFAEDLDPSTVTAALGLEPMRTGRAGEPIRPGSKGVLRRGAWEFAITAEPDVDMNDVVRQLLERLSSTPRTSEVWTALRRDHEVALRFVFFLDALNGWFFLDPEITRELAAFGCRVDFAFYNAGA